MDFGERTDGLRFLTLSQQPPDGTTHTAAATTTFASEDATGGLLREYSQVA
jgi:hypothetical protein